jgi:hypothetical protein
MSSGTSIVDFTCKCGGGAKAAVQWEYSPQSGPSYSSGGEPEYFYAEITEPVECLECTEIITDAEDQLEKMSQSEIMQLDERADAAYEED